MSRDVYASLSGASAAWTQLEIIANNLANSSTAGFKEQRVTFSLEEASADPLGDVYVESDVAVANMENGPIVRDEIPSHLALRGRGFFCVGEGAHQILMRSGAFQLDAEGHLVTSGGLKVQGQAGAIQFEPGTSFTVSADGTVLDQHGAQVDQLRLLNCDDVVPLGGTSWRANSSIYEAVNLEVVQGALEGSNTDPMHGMGELMEASRYFEAYQKAMQASDEMDGQLNKMAGS